MLIMTLTCALFCQGCGGLAKRTAVQTMSDLVAAGFPAYARERDLELAEYALAANVKLLEALLESEPEQPTLLLAVAQGLATYAYVVVEGELAAAHRKATETIAFQTRRAKYFYDRGLNYGLRALSRYDPVWQQALTLELTELENILQQLQVEATPALFWTAFCWGGILNMTRDNLDSIAALPRFEALLSRLLALDETYFYGAPHLLMAVHYASRSLMLGGDPKQARYHFSRARVISQNRFLLVPLLEAQYYAVQIQDRALFQLRLQEILDASDTLFPEQALLNTVAKQRAQFLLQQLEDLFV